MLQRRGLTNNCDNNAQEGENALRHATGYVALKLRCKFEKESTSKAVQFIEYLSNMAIEDESSYYTYTAEWIRLVDRGGGLFLYQ